MQYKTRRASAADMAAIKSLLQLLHLPVDDIDPTMLQNFIIAEKNSTLIGVAGLEPAGDAALLRSVAVAPQYARQGLGTLLSEEALKLAASLGIKHLYLLTDTAERFFSRLGFTRIERTAAPPALQKHAEFTHLCGNSAVCMHRAVD